MLATRDEERRTSQQRIEAMMDLLVQLSLAHAPEVPEERRPAAIAAANRRYRNWRGALAERMEQTKTGSAET